MQFDEKDCAAACIATISRQYGLKFPISKIREMAGTDRQGTNAYGVIKALEKLNFSAKAVKGNQDDFFTGFPLPAIAHIQKENGYNHFIIIHKITKKYILIADPANGKIEKYQIDHFFKIWTGNLVIMLPLPEFEKGNKTKNILFRFLGLLKPLKSLLMNIFLGSLIFTIFGVFSSFYFKFLIDDIIPNNLLNTLQILSISMIVLNFFKAIINAFRSQMLLYLSQKIDIYLIFGYYQHVLDLPLNFFGSRKVGEIISRFTDASYIRNAISSVTMTLMIDSLLTIVGGTVLFVQNALMFGVTLVIAFLYGITVFCYRNVLKNVSTGQMENNAQLTSYLVESIEGIETVKSCNAEKEACLKTEGKFIKVIKNIFQIGTISNIQTTITGFLSTGGDVILLWIGANYVLSGNMTIGQLLTFYVMLAYFLDPIKNLIHTQFSIQSAVVAANRMGEIFDVNIEKSKNEDKKLNPENLSGKIQFYNVDFRYGTRSLVLENISLTINQGEKVAIVGESGSGKTTLVKLLMNFYNWEKGTILINECNIKDINLNILRDKIAYVPQDTFLFSGTIRENLSLGMNGISLDDIIESSKMTKSHYFIDHLPLRYDSVLEENGRNLSGGQKQRLALTRAILKKPDILILDEATNNIDSVTEKVIEDTISNHFKNITTIVIAHRLSTIKNCDKIFVIEYGKIIESGNHEQLMDKKSKYFDLWKGQLEERRKKNKI